MEFVNSVSQPDLRLRREDVSLMVARMEEVDMECGRKCGMKKCGLKYGIKIRNQNAERKMRNQNAESKCGMKNTENPRYSFPPLFKFLYSISMTRKKPSSPYCQLTLIPVSLHHSSSSQRTVVRKQDRSVNQLSIQPMIESTNQFQVINQQQVSVQVQLDTTVQNEQCLLDEQKQLVENELGKGQGRYDHLMERTGVIEQVQMESKDSRVLYSQGQFGRDVISDSEESVEVRGMRRFEKNKIDLINELDSGNTSATTFSISQEKRMADKCEIHEIASDTSVILNERSNAAQILIKDSAAGKGLPSKSCEDDDVVLIQTVPKNTQKPIPSFLDAVSLSKNKFTLPISTKPLEKDHLRESVPLNHSRSSIREKLLCKSVKIDFEARTDDLSKKASVVSESDRSVIQAESKAHISPISSKSNESKLKEVLSSPQFKDLDLSMFSGLTKAPLAKNDSALDYMEQVATDLFNIKKFHTRSKTRNLSLKRTFDEMDQANVPVKVNATQSQPISDARISPSFEDFEDPPNQFDLKRFRNRCLEKPVKTVQRTVLSSNPLENKLSALHMLSSTNGPKHPFEKKEINGELFLCKTTSAAPLKTVSNHMLKIPRVQKFSSKQLGAVLHSSGSNESAYLESIVKNDSAPNLFPISESLDSESSNESDSKSEMSESPDNETSFASISRADNERVHHRPQFEDDYRPTVIGGERKGRSNYGKAAHIRRHYSKKAKKAKKGSNAASKVKTPRVKSEKIKLEKKPRSKKQKVDR